jgi:hypothetical protein
VIIRHILFTLSGGYQNEEASHTSRRRFRSDGSFVCLRRRRHRSDPSALTPLSFFDPLPAAIRCK